MHSPILEPWPVPPPAARSKSSKGSVDLSTVSSHHSPAFYVHPSLTPGHDPCKGRLLRTSSPVSAGTIILVDTPYAIVPTADPSRDDPLICSNLFCSRKVPQDGRGASCPRSCLKDVVWCNDACRTDDYARHQFECNWLKQKAADIRQVEGQYNFLTLWHVVRLLAARNLEMQRKTSISQIQQPLLKQDFKHGWEAVESCCAFLDTWPESQIRHWTRLTETYLCNTPELAHSLSPNEMLFLLCKEETNTFGLYPKLTGPEYAIDCCKEPRGISYAYCLYPRAAMFNHSCLPNVSNRKTLLVPLLLD